MTKIPATKQAQPTGSSIRCNASVSQRAKGVQSLQFASPGMSQGWGDCWLKVTLKGRLIIKGKNSSFICLLSLAIGFKYDYSLDKLPEMLDRRLKVCFRDARTSFTINSRTCFCGCKIEFLSESSSLMRNLLYNYVWVSFCLWLKEGCGWEQKQDRLQRQVATQPLILKDGGEGEAWGRRSNKCPNHGPNLVLTVEKKFRNARPTFKSVYILIYFRRNHHTCARSVDWNWHRGESSGIASVTITQTNQYRRHAKSRY